MKKIFLLFLCCFCLVYADTLSQIRQNGKLRVGVAMSWPPFSKQNSDGSFEGFEVMFAKEIAKTIFLDKSGKVEFVGMSVEERIPALENNKVDIVIWGFTITDERKTRIDFTTPYFSMNLAVLTKKDSQTKTLNDLRNKTIGAVKGGVPQEYFTQAGFTITTCEAEKDCYKLLKNGEIDAYADDNLIVLIYPLIDTDVEVSIKNIGKPFFYGIGVQKGNKELLDLINDDMVNFSKKGFFKKAYEETFGPFYKGTADKKYFLLDDIYSFFG